MLKAASILGILFFIAPAGCNSQPPPIEPAAEIEWGNDKAPPFQPTPAQRASALALETKLTALLETGKAIDPVAPNCVATMHSFFKEVDELEPQAASLPKYEYIDLTSSRWHIRTCGTCVRSNKEFCAAAADSLKSYKTNGPK